MGEARYDSRPPDVESLWYSRIMSYGILKAMKGKDFFVLFDEDTYHVHDNYLLLSWK